MSPRSSQPLIWICVALLTLGLHAAALLWITFPKHPEPKELEAPTRLDLSILQPTAAAPKPVPTPEPTPEPLPEPLPTPPIPEPEPEPTPPPPKVEPPVKPEPPKPDPAILKREQEKAARDREIAKKRMAEKRIREKAARAVKAKRDAQAAAARKRAAEAKRIATMPSVISRRKPTYPRSAQRAGLQGTTTLTITIGTTGRVTSVRISKSSGHTALDNAAVSAARTWRFKPAKNGLGQAVPYSMSAPVPFKLQ
jgi:protein TonB